MPERVLLDNDIVLKTASYSLADAAVAATTVGGTPPAMLGVGRFVVRGRLARAGNIAQPTRAADAFERMLAGMILVEPDDEEIEAAAELEAEANRRDLELDGGESQLLAILANRECDLLVTGDKRAIAAMAVVAPAQAAARIACLEQLMAHVVLALGAAKVREHVCGEPSVDRAVTNCVACSAAHPPADADVLAGLASYVRHLDGSAPGVLVAGCDLSCLAA